MFHDVNEKHLSIDLSYLLMQELEGGAPRKIIKYKHGGHGKQLENKAIVLAEIVRGSTNKSEIRSKVRKKLSLKNGRDVSYHIRDLARRGIITEKGNNVSLKIKAEKDGRKKGKKAGAVEKAIEICKILAKNRETGEAILPGIYFLTELSADFIADRLVDVFPASASVSLMDTMYRSAKENISKFKEEGLDVLNFTKYLYPEDALERNVRTIIHVLERNLLIDKYISQGVKDPPFEVHGNFTKTDRSYIRNGAFGIPYFEPARSERDTENEEIESQAVSEFIEGVIKRSLDGKRPDVSMLKRSEAKHSMIKLIEEAEEALTSLAHLSASQIIKIRDQLSERK